MSKLNAGAFAFVPGRGSIPQSSQSQPTPPLERPEKSETPRPAPTIFLNIGGTAPPSTPTPALAPIISATPAAQPSRSSQVLEAPLSLPPQTKKTDIPRSTKPSKTFTTERAKTDTNTITQEIKTVADRAILEDLYGTCKYANYFKTLIITLRI